MALLRSHLQVCLILLLLAVAFPASMVVASGECYRTAMSVPRRCRAQFIKALFNPGVNGISYDCCIMLVCVLDIACFAELAMFCHTPNWDVDCGLRSSNPSKLTPPPAEHH